MQISTVTAEKRNPGGRHANERIRRAGNVPAIIYGHGESPEAVSLSAHELGLALEHLQHVLKLKVGGQETLYLLKDVQYDHLQRTPIHVDLMRVDPNERVKVTVPVEFRGTPHGTTVGGELVTLLADVHIECKLLEIPDSVRAKIDGLEIGSALHIRELELPADVKALHSPEEVVCLVRHKKTDEAVAGAPAEGEAGKEPEVIGRIAKEKPEEGAESK